MSLKRSAPDVDDDDDIVILDVEPTANGQPPAKKQKLSTPEPVKSSGKAKAKQGEISSPSKRRRLENDGLIMMEGADDKLNDDIIVID